MKKIILLCAAGMSTSRKRLHLRGLNVKLPLILLLKQRTRLPMPM